MNPSPGAQTGLVCGSVYGALWCPCAGLHSCVVVVVFMAPSAVCVQDCTARWSSAHVQHSPVRKEECASRPSTTPPSPAAAPAGGKVGVLGGPVCALTVHAVALYEGPYCTKDVDEPSTNLCVCVCVCV